MKKLTAIKILLVTIAFPLFTGCAPERPVDVAPQVGTAADYHGAAPTQPPPKNQEDVVPACPGSLALWWVIPGHWEWRGDWVWAQGHWRTRPHPGDIWLPGKWAAQDGVYVWQRGHWRSGAPDDEESHDR